MFKPDKPIKSYKEDILDRAPFAQSFADAILSYKEKESIVIGLFGKWGSGKTSVINMAIEKIKEITANNDKNEKTIIIRFNPWNFSDQNQLISQFFKQLSITLKQKDYGKNAKQIGEWLEIYASFFEPVPIISYFTNKAKKFGNALKKWGEYKHKLDNLDTIKEKLNKLLEKKSNKIIIIIDDIDRLNNTEIRQIFQLVKSLGDFSNTVYILSFDKDIVIKALEKVQESSGVEYLEKVVQIPFDIPLISKQYIDRLLLNQLEVLIKDMPDKKVDNVYWGNIYYGGLKYFFGNIRDVIRYINSLSFSFNLVRDEVNIIDFFAITAIQIFIPEVYDGIKDNKDIFSGAFENSSYRQDSGTEKEKLKERSDKIIQSNNRIPPKILVNLLKRLFPKIEAIYDGINYGYDWLKEWRKKCRICSPDMFDIYFRFSLIKEEISQKEIETILSMGNNSELFSKALLNFNKDGKIIRFLERMEDYTRDEIPVENIHYIITSLMDIGDLFPEGKTTIFEIDTPMRILRIFYQLLHRIQDRQERFIILKNAIEKAEKSLYTIVHELSTQDQQHAKFGLAEKPEPKEKLTLNPTQLEELEKLACSKIEIWANDGRLLKHKHLPYILYRWRNWGQQDNVKNFIENTIKTNNGLIDFITGFLRKQQSIGMGDYVAQTNWRIYWKDIKEFIDVKSIVSRIRRIFNSPDYKYHEERKKIAIQTFLDTYDGKIKDF